jgi:arylsulfatase A-like enzyme
MTGFHSGHFGREGLSGTEIKPDQKILTTAQMLQQAGYATAGIGKMAPLTAPLQQGFDFFVGQINQAYCHNMYPRFIDVANGTLNLNLSLNWKIPDNAHEARAACMAKPKEYNYTVDITHRQSMEWLQKHVAQQQLRSRAGVAHVPFFLYESFTVPHAGGWGHAPATPESGAPVPTDGIYSNQSWPDVERDHASVITYLDNYVGELLSLVQSLGIDEQTIIFFASDNGAHLEGGHSYKFFNSTGGLLGHKRSLYEGGVRSPTMVRWPGTIKPAVSSFRWAFWDFMPTAAELAHGKVPGNIDGVSSVPTLLGKAQPPKPYVYFTWRGSILGSYNDTESKLTPDLPLGWQAVQSTDGLLKYYHVPSGKYSTRHPLKPLETTGRLASGYAVVVGDWKRVVGHCVSSQHVPSKADKFEIYNLASDPFEQNNLAQTAEGKQAGNHMLDIVLKAGVSCNCFQC